MGGRSGMTAVELCVREKTGSDVVMCAGTGAGCPHSIIGRCGVASQEEIPKGTVEDKQP